MARATQISRRTLWIVAAGVIAIAAVAYQGYTGVSWDIATILGF